MATVSVKGLIANSSNTAF